MSYILDALRKAERERSLGRPPDLRSVPMPQPAPRRNPGWMLVALTLAANGVLAGYLIWQRPWTDTESAVASVAPDPVIPTHTAVAPQAQVPHAPPPASPAETAGPSAVSSPDFSPGPTLTAIASDVQAPPPALPPDPPPETEAFPASLPPPLHAMPGPFRQALPALNLDVHVYSEQPDRRFVIINSTQYRIGEALREGPQLEDIASEGAVLSFLGERFLLPVTR